VTVPRITAVGRRDRDRLRHEVLEGLGWRLHRIWSSDWFRNPGRETDRLLAAIKAACEEPPPGKNSTRASQELNAGTLPPDAGPKDSLNPAGADLSPTEVSRPASLRSVPYRECSLAVPHGVDLLDIPPHQLADFSVTVVKSEGPIHIEEVARRIREAFGLERTERRILEAVGAALRSAERRGAVRTDQDFWADDSACVPRDRRNAALPLRRADRIAPAEYQAAIRVILKQAVGCDQVG
jgi:hypothetical protein